MRDSAPTGKDTSAPGDQGRPMTGTALPGRDQGRTATNSAPPTKKKYEQNEKCFTLCLNVCSSINKWKKILRII